VSAVRRLAAPVLIALMALGAVAAPSGATGPVAKKAKVPAIHHVFVINLENTSYDQVFIPSSPAPYLTKTLEAKGQLLSQYYAIGHVSLPNYIAQISGQGPNLSTRVDCIQYKEFTQTGNGELGQALGDGCVYPASVKTIADQLAAKGLTWRGYMEDIGASAAASKTCRHPAIGATDSTIVARKGDQYATRHDPFVYFHSIVDSPSCAKNVVGLDALTADLKSAKRTPNFSFITPNLCNDGHDHPCVDGKPGGLVSADAFLKQWVPTILKSAAFKKDGLLVVTFDESEGDTSSCCRQPAAQNLPDTDASKGGGRVGAVVVSRFVKAGTTNATPYNHYALLCSIEDLFKLPHLGYAAESGLKCFGRDVYNKKG
jgi:hypothetical protein